MSNRFWFIGGRDGPWRVTGNRLIVGEGLADAERLDIRNTDTAPALSPTAWMLQGFTSNLRYATTPEVTSLRAIQPPLGRPEATRAALIPLKKSAVWWDMPQDERRAIFEETSHHTEIGLAYLPAVARRLHHCRDIGEPFDFLTWFEFAPEHEAAFDALLAQLRATREWTFVEREAEIRLTRE